MNTAINLIMAGIFFRLANFRTYGGFDLVPDFIGALLIIAAIVVARKKAGEIGRAKVLSGAFLVLSLGTFYSFLNSDSTSLMSGLYLIYEIAFSSVEILLYHKLLSACCEMYDEKLSGADASSLLIYAAVSLAGIVTRYMTWQSATSGLDSDALTFWSVATYIYVAVNIVASSYVMYRFYLKKPKFN